MNSKIILLSGDPNSINSEIIYKSWNKINSNLKTKIYLISNFNLLKKQFKKLNLKIKIKEVKSIDETLKDTNILKIISLDLKKFSNPFKINKKIASKFVLDSLNLAHSLALRKNIKGIINCPINKNLLPREKIGVTEFLASKCKIKKSKEIMLIFNEKLSICPLTTHIDVKEIYKNINKKIVINKIKTLNSWYIKKFKKKPKIAILGLNPHNAELRKNSEERKIIIPSINHLKKVGINLKGPYSADTIFLNEYKKHDLIIGMFHDQILPSYKAVFKYNAINITVGLKYLRVSPDHGTAINLIGKNNANEESLLKCIKFVNKFGQ